MKVATEKSMTFSEEWDVCYKNNTQMAIWPWSELVSFVMKYGYRANKKIRILELGCGAGANIPFFMSLNAEYFAMDGSATIVKTLKKKFPTIKENIVIGDFTKEIPFKGTFDLIVDRSAITHNTTRGIMQCLDLVYTKLKKGRKYIGTGWFSTMHSDYKHGIQDQDFFTRTNYKNGQFVHVGRVHFSDKKHLLDLFKKFKILVLEHNITKTEVPKKNNVIAGWNIVAQK